MVGLNEKVSEPLNLPVYVPPSFTTVKKNPRFNSIVPHSVFTPSNERKIKFKELAFKVTFIYEPSFAN